MFKEEKKLFIYFRLTAELENKLQFVLNLNMKRCYCH